MKISNREKILLGVLLCLIILFSYQKFIYSNQRAKIETLKAEKNDYLDKVNKLDILVENMPKKEADTKILNAKIQDKSLKLYPKIIQEKIIIELDTLMNDSKIIGSINFSEITNQPIEMKVDEKEKEKISSDMSNLSDEYNTLEGIKKEEKKEDVKSESKKLSTEPIEELKVTLSFSGKYEEVMSFIKSLEAYSKKVAVTTINLSQSNIENINGTASLEFFAIPKLGLEDAEYLRWDLNNEYGKTNIFDSSLNVDLAKTVEDINIGKEESFDFVASLKPINSDLPTMMFGKSKDSDRKTYVYADNHEEENLEIYLTKSGDKYYYKYKTSKNSYPSDFNGEGIEFNPSLGNINIKIFSSKRTGESDLSGANIKIFNKSGLNVLVNIEGEDSLRPRVKVSSEGGNVDIKKN
ncbi:hypothetical protein [Clostridium algidicarnis]|uniref:Type IV pilus assembly protein PilO n=1 Tax=Clostridium algidicarnis DSM 15099 TaxID=1121295 RepID=A0A2S6FZS1_9CLOT|nr:hypothetical protein [Clostridium algidicarnis]MBU3196312.1 hypothetical protein [Clostridium algidicarnis]PPK49094.1 type IV pilus assembly protein PilO [Clostridium algidicarnis DSM 15099]